MENVGAVTFNESYLFRVARLRRPARAARDRACCTSSATCGSAIRHDAVVERPLAERVVRDLGVDPRHLAGHRVHGRLGHVRERREDARRRTGPAPLDASRSSAKIHDLGDVEVNFDAITYDKGASVLKQLVAWVGLDAFQRGVGAYLTAHAGGNATLRDLLDELERASGRDLTRWSELWLETAGVNTLRPSSRRMPRARSPPHASSRRAATGASDPAPASPRARLLRARRRRRSCARTASSSTSTAPSTEVPELVGLPRPTCCS